jgi:hypothetical protein
MRLRCLALSLAVTPLLTAVALGAGGNRLAYLDEFCDPYYVGLDTPKLVTPQWIGEEVVELVIVRPDGTNNGAWLKYDHLWVQNEDTGGTLPNHIDSRRFTDLLGEKSSGVDNRGSQSFRRAE